jgi:hypothetical protein
MRRRRLTLKAILVAFLTAANLGMPIEAPAQRRGTTPASRPAAPGGAAPRKEAAEIVCPAPLGEGLTTKRAFCDVLTGRLPAEGILIPLPPHVGTVILTFDLHNRHQYSEELVLAKRAYARYTATIGALTADNTLISRAAIQSDFRTAADLFDRVGGGAGPGGLKAVAPTGVEHITITIPDGEHRISLLGEKLTIERLGESPATYSSVGRPIAIVSNVMIEYRPAPPAPATPPARGRGQP